MNAPADKTNSEREALLALFTAVLRPLMPLALEQGISARQVSDSVRRAYVQALEERMSGQDRRLSDARLALIAGLTRSEVNLLRSLGSASAKPSKTESGDAKAEDESLRMGTLLSVWHTHPRFSGAYGLALDLDLRPTADLSRRTFAELVETACPGMDQESLLDQLIATDSAEIVEGMTIRCKSRVAVFGKSDDMAANRIERAAKCLETAARSFAYNLQHIAAGNDYFERMVTSNHPLSVRSRDEFAHVAQVRGDEYVVELDTWLSKHTQPDLSPTAKRYGVGVYFFEESQTEQQTDAASGTRLVSSGIEGRQGRAEEIDVLVPQSSVKALTKKPGE